MSGRRLIFLTHAEVVIDPAVPVPKWGLSDIGRARHAAFADSAEVAHVTTLASSPETKAREGAAPVADRLALPIRAISALGENDRSATGYLPPDEFERTADAFFENPDTAVRGWERARAAQARVVAAVTTLAELDDAAGDILILAHGAVGALLRCHLKGCEITRAEDQPPGGGAWFETRTGGWPAPGDWSRI
ncbi:histidine phosphatase family protein [Aestuariibius sp. 2305UL40-4]|uniref:histidine phosphatase family protein n=1 Tax=Aestuariibius violaceus TaxID=3234132 RepID=UPI00345F132D